MSSFSSSRPRGRSARCYPRLEALETRMVLNAWFDTDQNGYDDVWFSEQGMLSDYNEDGLADQGWFDTDRNGYQDLLWMDCDGDGQMSLEGQEFYLLSREQEAALPVMALPTSIVVWFPEVGITDTDVNGDGVPDMRRVDADGDGFPETILSNLDSDTNADGSPNWDGGVMDTNGDHAYDRTWIDSNNNGHMDAGEFFP